MVKVGFILGFQSTVHCVKGLRALLLDKGDSDAARIMSSLNKYLLCTYHMSVQGVGYRVVGTSH